MKSQLEQDMDDALAILCAESYNAPTIQAILERRRQSGAAVIGVVAAAYNVKKLAQTMEEVVDGVRESLGQESTHYLVVADDVKAMVDERNRLKEALLSLRDGVDDGKVHCDPLPVSSSWRYVVDRALGKMG